MDVRRTVHLIGADLKFHNLPYITLKKKLSLHQIVLDRVIIERRLRKISPAQIFTPKLKGSFAKK